MLGFSLRSCFLAPDSSPQRVDRGMEPPTETSKLPRNPLPSPFTPWWLLLVILQQHRSSDAKKHSREKRNIYISLPQTESANIKTRKEGSKNQTFPCSCPSASLPSRKISLLTRNLPITTILTFLLSSPLSHLSETLIHRAWTAAALLRGAVSENKNNSHQCLKASYTQRSWFQVNIQSLWNNCVE